MTRIRPASANRVKLTLPKIKLIISWVFDSKALNSVSLETRRISKTWLYKAVRLKNEKGRRKTSRKLPPRSAKSRSKRDLELWRLAQAACQPPFRLRYRATTIRAIKGTA